MGVPSAQTNLISEAYSIGADVMTTTGITATKLDVVNTDLTDLTVFDLTVAEELCIPDLDYRWSGDGLGPTVFKEIFCYGTIVYTTCLTRYSP